MELVGRRLMLRPLTADDVSDRYVGWLNDPEVTRYLEPRDRPATRAAILHYLQRFAGGPDEIFAIIERAGGAHVGNVTLNHVHPVHLTADTGLLLGERDRWGQGYASEAWSLVLRHAFDDLRLRKVIAGACEPNRASLAVLHKLGFRLEGTLRGECLVDGRHVDALRLGLLAAEFVPHASALDGGQQ